MKIIKNNPASLHCLRALRYWIAFVVIAGTFIMEDEIWLPIRGYEGIYEVSHFGAIKRVLYGKGTRTGILSQCDRRVNMKVELCKNGIQKTHYVHHLVLENFNCEKPEGLECCHNDGNYRNNYVGNLRWDTRSSNVQDAIKHGTLIRPIGENASNSKLSNSDVLEIRELLKSGISQRKIAKRYNVWHTAIGNINRNKTWTHI